MSDPINSVILALESSAVAASVALCRGETLLAQSFQCSGHTHSQTLLPMAEEVLRAGGVALSDIDLIAVAHGPGSFTGLRIGVAAAQGLAWGAEKPCVGCSTLEAMAWNLAGLTGEVCAVMDARRQQVYNARFRVDGQNPPERLTPDRAISLPDLLCELRQTPTPPILVGDGAELCWEAFQKAGLSVRMAPPNLRLQSAWGVARLALEKARAGQTGTPSQLQPVYHRLSQAERERLERERTAGSL